MNRAIREQLEAQFVYGLVQLNLFTNRTRCTLEFIDYWWMIKRIRRGLSKKKKEENSEGLVKQLEGAFIIWERLLAFQLLWFPCMNVSHWRHEFNQCSIWKVFWCIDWGIFVSYFHTKSDSILQNSIICSLCVRERVRCVICVRMPRWSLEVFLGSWSSCFILGNRHWYNL